MKFTKNSETLMMAFMDDFSSFLPKRRLYQQRRMDSLLKKFYNEFLIRETFFDATRAELSFGDVFSPLELIIHHVNA